MIPELELDTGHPAQAAADRYFEEGMAAEQQASVHWAAAHDGDRPEDFRRVSMHAYERAAARARSLFKRHDVLLDNIARDDAEAQEVHASRS